MAGSFISVDAIGDDEIRQGLNQLLNQMHDLTPAFRSIGEVLLESTQERMSNEQAPDGSGWEQLSVFTLMNKEKTGQSNKILRGFGTLADTLNYQISANQLQLGSNLEYAATHQFGREDANIPERPFLGLSENDKNDVLDILQDHFIK